MKKIFYLLFLAASGAVWAQDHANLVFDHPHARPTVPGQTSGAAYITMENKGKAGDKLLRISSPASQSAEVHSMTMDGNVMRMREVGQVELKPAAKVVMSAGDGYHIMLVGLKKPLKPGDRIPLNLYFEKAGKVELEAIVDAN